MEDFDQSCQVQEILEYQELYKLTKGKINPISNNLKIDLSGLTISRENIQNFWLILKNLPKETTELDVTQRDLILQKEMRFDTTPLLNLADLPKQIKKIYYLIGFAQIYQCINIEKYLEQIAKLPKFINQFQINIQQDQGIVFFISLDNQELEVIINVNERKERYGLLTKSFKEIFENFGDKFNQFCLNIKNNQDDEYTEYTQIYEALQYLPKNLRSIEIVNDIQETQESNQILANSLKGISQSVQRIYFQQNGILNNHICSLQQFPQAKTIIQNRNYNINEQYDDYKFQLLKSQFFLNMIGEDLQQNEINNVIPNLKEVFLNKSIKDIFLKFKNLSELTINNWQQLLQQFEFLNSRLKNLNVSLNQTNNGLDPQNNDFSQTLFSRIQNLPRKLESLKLKLTNTNFLDTSFQLFSNNIQNLPGTLKYFKLKIGNYNQRNINYDLLFQNIKQLPNSLTEFHIIIQHPQQAFNQAEHFKNCIGIFTKDRKIQNFTIKTQSHIILRDIFNSKTLQVILSDVRNLNNIFNQFDDQSFYLEGVDSLQLKINLVQTFPNGNECEQLGNQLKNISKQFQEVKIQIGQEFPFGQNQESLIMYFKLADQNFLRKVFEIQNSNYQTIFLQTDKKYFYNMKFLTNYNILNDNIFNELDQFLGTEDYQYENLTLQFQEMRNIDGIMKFKEIHKFIHPKLKEFDLHYQQCNISDSDLPFSIQALGESLQSSNIEIFNLNVQSNSKIHNKFLTNVFSRIYLWESLKSLNLYLPSTNMKSKGLSQFSKIIQGRLPKLEKFQLDLSKTESSYKLLSSSVAHLIQAFNCNVCPKLESFELSINEMKNKYVKKDLKDIGYSITKLSQTMKCIFLNLKNMIEQQGKGLKYLVKSIATLRNLEKVDLGCSCHDQIYQESVFFFAVKIPKYFDFNKLRELIITFDVKDNIDIDQNKLLLKLIKQLKQTDLTRCFCDIYIYNMTIAIGGFEEAYFDLKKCTISKETYDILTKFIFDLPPNIQLPEDLSLVPMYDYIQTNNNQRINHQNSDSSDDSEEDESDILELDQFVDF
ncbi:hypothetical protein TTHERM_00969570 (macronuclear) [Tetrahymena thermophila SB210]|uniref:Uncharacterized protein n=1 Tax=Tetrahymena thermophila (strain SB210) TaxID=312017 RepID=Q24DL7_TETTS|nr:hypothetical protein TTHERM_00969570 [Tetrahymena thermophila SB210]EAS05831.2 hypothetical protein TTHERM_00969570 [Tetrahymena thermophila SB210]|eukprot:XP_001026076.2 hypothetical protein TTHERM_00969570 [Tetrahymena thermophila SB210]